MASQDFNSRPPSARAMPSDPAATSASPVVSPELLAILHKLSEGVQTLGSGIDELRNLLQSSTVDSATSVSTTTVAPNQGLGPSDISTTANVNIALGRDGPTSSHFNDLSRKIEDENIEDENTDTTTLQHAHGVIVDPGSRGNSSSQFENDTIPPPFEPTIEEVVAGNNTIGRTSEQHLSPSDYSREVLENNDIPIPNPDSNHLTSARDQEVLEVNQALSHSFNSIKEPKTLDFASVRDRFLSRGAKWVNIAGKILLALPDGGKFFLEPERRNVWLDVEWSPQFEQVNDPGVEEQRQFWQLASSQWEGWLKKDIHNARPMLFSFSKDNQFLEVIENWNGAHILENDEGLQVWFQCQQPFVKYSLRQASIIYHIMYNNEYFFDSSSMSYSYLSQHIGAWIPIDKLQSPQYWMRDFQYRLRMFKTDDDEYHFSRVGKIAHCREKGRFPISRTTIGVPGAASPWFYERRVSLLGLMNGEYKLRRIVVMDDNSYPPWLEEKFPKSNLGPEDGQVLYLLLRHYHTEWEKDWHSCLDELDISTTVTLEDISDDAKFDTWMFDGPSLDRSRLYFAALQQLRIFSAHIKETVRDVEWILEGTKQDREQPDSFEFWKRILAPLKDAEEGLFSRIDKKTEDIKTLRDGLFNSTSVREATRSTQMNRYVIVFTIVTVLYTPPSFVSTLLATPYFTKRDPEELKQAIAIATGTTIVAVLVFLALANSFNNIFEGSDNLLRPKIRVAQTKIREAKRLAAEFFRKRLRRGRSSREDIEMS